MVQMKRNAHHHPTTTTSKSCRRIRISAVATNSVNLDRMGNITLITTIERDSGKENLQASSCIEELPVMKTGQLDSVMEGTTPKEAQRRFFMEALAISGVHGRRRGDGTERTNPLPMSPRRFPFSYSYVRGISIPEVAVFDDRRPSSD